MRVGVLCDPFFPLLEGDRLLPLCDEFLRLSFEVGRGFSGGSCDFRILGDGIGFGRGAGVDGRGMGLGVGRPG